MVARENIWSERQEARVISAKLTWEEKRPYNLWMEVLWGGYGGRRAKETRSLILDATQIGLCEYGRNRKI